MITYENLWKTMEERGISQYKLVNQYDFSSGQLDRLRRNIGVNVSTINKLCGILECEPCDIITYSPDLGGGGS